MEMFDFTSWTGLVRFALVLVVPLLVAVVTKRFTSVPLKVLVLAVLSAASTILTSLGEALATNTEFNAPYVIGNALVGVALSQAAYWLGWSPWGVTDKIADATASFGLPESPTRLAKHAAIEAAAVPAILVTEATAPEPTAAQKRKAAAAAK